MKSGIRGQAEAIEDLVRFAPEHDFFSTESAVASYDDTRFGETTTNGGYNLLQGFYRAATGILITRAQLGP